MIRHLLLILSLSSLLLCFSCEPGKTETPKTNTGKNLSGESIDANIRALSTADWTAGSYNEILNKQINSATEIEDADKKALTKMLQENYADQIIRCATNIMDDSQGCPKSHDKLHQMMDSLNVVVPNLQNDYRAADIKDIQSRYDTHEKMMKFSVSSLYGKKVNANSVYDASYDRERRATAAKYRSLKPKCDAIKKKIDSAYVESILKKRREDFQNKLEDARAKEQANNKNTL